MRARALVAAYLAYLGSAREQPNRARPDGGGRHEHDRLRPARVHRCHRRRVLRRLRVSRTRVRRGSASPPRPSATARPAGAPSRAAPARSSTGTATSAGRRARRARGLAGGRAARSTRARLGRDDAGRRGASRPRPCRGRPTSSPSTALGSARAGADGSRVTRRVGTSSTRLRGARLGAGLTSIPPVAAVDAAGAVLKDPMVPEERRTCPSCGSPVGRSRDGQPGRTEGFCPTCRNPFSFTPKLQEGDVVGGQYVVAGAIAHGGLGWIYAARDRNVSDRWVVLKGLLNSGDPDALAAAIAERQFLAQVEHPLIVEIYNFVTHEGAGYIVMEYVGGTSLKQLLKERMRAAGGAYDPLPGRPGDRLHHRGPARLPVPARPQPRVLRLQARQPHPGGRRRQADRPRRGAPPRRPRLRDLRDDGLPGAGGAARRPVRRVRHLHDRAHADRARHGVPRLPEHLRHLPPAGRRDAAVPEARLAVPAAAQGLRPGPGGPLRLGRRAARAAPRGAPRGRGRSGARARPSTRRRPCSSTSPRSPTTPSTGRTSPACAPTTATRRCRGCGP